MRDDDAETAEAPAEAKGTALFSQLERVLQGSGSLQQGPEAGESISRPRRDYQAVIELVRGAADSIRGMEERARESETRLQELVQRTAHEIKAAEARVEAAEARTRAAEARAEESERRARETQEWLDQILNVISEELKR